MRTCVVLLALLGASMAQQEDSTGLVAVPATNLFYSGPTVNAVALPALSRSVEPLTDAEKVALADARKKAKQAQDDLAVVEESVKRAHGSHAAGFGLSCGPQTVVTLWADWALIEENYSLCAAY